MGDLSFSGIERNTLDIDCVGRIKRNRQDVRSENILNTTHHIARGSDVRFRHRERLSVVLNRLENVG
jgi:hypothetical protein